MAPPVRAGQQPQRKTSAHDLERIRINQQRSRDRKRAYIAELEHKVQDLTTQLQTQAGDAVARLTPISENEDRVLSSVSVQLDSAHETTIYENAIRSNLLRALGVDDNAQKQFINASMRGKDGGRHWLGAGESHGSPSQMQVQETDPQAMEDQQSGDTGRGASHQACVTVQQKQSLEISGSRLSIPDQRGDAAHTRSATNAWIAEPQNASWGSSTVSSDAYQQDLGIDMSRAAMQYSHPALHMSNPNVPTATAEASALEGAPSMALSNYQIDSSAPHAYSNHATRNNSPRFIDAPTSTIPCPTTQAGAQDMTPSGSANVSALSPVMWSASSRSSGCCSKSIAICPESINVLMKIHPLPAAANDPDAPYASSGIVRPYSQTVADLKQSCLNYCLAVRQCCSSRNDPHGRNGTHSLQRSRQVDVDACSPTTTDQSTTDEDTTACSIAFSVIYQNNMRGYTLAELESRLHDGYRWGDSEQGGCRVVNRVLFQVLAEIS